MKNSCKYLLVTAFAAVSFAALAASVKIDDLNIVTVSLKIQLQAAGVNSKDGAVRTFAKPLIQNLNTKNLLDRLALDKNIQGLYASTKFPSGANLALAGTSFVVVRDNSEFIVDVSDIISLTAGTNDIMSGSTNNTTGLASPNLTELTVIKLNFDDTFIVGGSDLSFSVSGVDTIKTNDSTPNSSTGKYTEKTSDKVSDASGEGQSGGTPFVITGSIQGNRNVTLTYSPPAPPAS